MSLTIPLKYIFAFIFQHFFAYKTQKNNHPNQSGTYRNISLAFLRRVGAVFGVKPHIDFQ